VHPTEEQKRGSDDLLAEITVENVEDHRADRPDAAIYVIIRHADISSDIPLGPWHLSGSLGSVIQTVETCLPSFLCDMEARVPKARRAALSSSGLWRALFGEGTAEPDLVSDRENGR
jgi:hypothetical protein